MQVLWLKPEIQCFPLWSQEEPFDRNTNPASLAISAALIAALDDWRRRWDDTYDMNDPRDPGFASCTDEVYFHQDGEQLAVLLQEELGPDWEVRLHIPG